MEDGKAGTPADVSGTGAGVWDAGALRRELEGMVREAMEERALAQPRRENSQEEEGRMAAVESRLQRLEERARMNRDGA
jgi:hypothetical protein